MKTKLYCRRCGEQLIGDGGYCHVCREDRGDGEVDERHFPDDPKNKVFAVDVYVTVCKCMKVEAKDGEDAERKALAELLLGVFRTSDDAQMIRSLADLGFQDAEETEYKCSGEADEHGDIQYY